MTTIETPALDVDEKRQALLFHMLSHTVHFLERFLERQEGLGTPQSLEVADYVRKELETARGWHTEIKEGK